MPVGTKKPAVFNPTGGNRAATFDNIGDGTILVGSAVFAATYNIIPEQIYKWADPTLSGSFTRADLPLGTSVTGTRANCIAYDTVNTKVYVGYNPNDTGANQVVNIASVNPTTLASTMLVNEYVIGTSSPAPTANNGIATDGTHIYYTYGPGGGGNAKILKFKCSDGSFVASLTLPNTGTGTTITDVRTLTLNGGSLYVTGVGSAGYAAKVATDFSSTTALATVLTNPCDDVIFTATYFWEGDEAAGFPGRMCRTALDMSSTATFTIPGASPKNLLGWIDATYYDGTYLWVSLIQDVSNVGNPSVLVKIDEATFDVVAKYVPGVVHMNEIWPAGTGFWCCSYNTSASGPSAVQYFPVT